MAQEAFCPIHGPYPAHLGQCPYCASEGRTSSSVGVSGPGVTGEEETRVYTGPPGMAGNIDDAPTEVGWMRGGVDSGEEETVLLGRQRGFEADIDETILEHPVEGLLGWLIVKRGGRRGQIFKLGEEVTIGRRGTDIVLADPKVSQLHAKIGIRDNKFVIVDVLSKNGTYVNGERIQGERVLEENDEIRIGDVVMVLKTLPPDND